MKKFFTVFMAVLFLLTLASVPAFATEATEGTKEVTQVWGYKTIEGMPEDGYVLPASLEVGMRKLTNLLPVYAGQRTTENRKEHLVVCEASFGKEKGIVILKSSKDFKIEAEESNFLGVVTRERDDPSEYKISKNVKVSGQTLGNLKILSEKYFWGANRTFLIKGYDKENKEKLFLLEINKKNLVGSETSEKSGTKSSPSLPEPGNPGENPDNPGETLPPAGNPGEGTDKPPAGNLPPIQTPGEGMDKPPEGGLPPIQTPGENLDKPAVGIPEENPDKPEASLPPLQIPAV